MTNITYTFPLDCPIASLRGKTFTRGVVVELKGKRLVRFAERCDGNEVCAIIAGKPELERQVAEIDAAAEKAKAIAAANLAAIGWGRYEPIYRAALNARYAYDAAQDGGSYPAREAAAMRTADHALDVASQQLPGAAAYARAEAFALASNYRKSCAGQRAVDAIRNGADPIAAVAAMEVEWSAAAREMADRS